LPTDIGEPDYLLNGQWLRAAVNLAFAKTYKRLVYSTHRAEVRARVRHGGVPHP
jgi:hypothetical protein